MSRGTSVLNTVLAGEASSFALLHRPGTGATGQVDVLLGEVSRVSLLADVPLPPLQPGAAHDVLVLLPYRQISERGFACADDGEKIVALTVTEQESVAVNTLLEQIPDCRVSLSGVRFEPPDDEYAQIIGDVLRDAIGTGEGANFVIKRSLAARIADSTPQVALSLFRRLLRQESGTYWTFLVHTPERTLVGATPERHVTVNDGVATMNPISGTYRYPPAGPDLGGVLGFLDDGKESDELYMVLDEELKMMARICRPGVRVIGPRLKQMSRLAHTEYLITGETQRDVREVLRETMFAPTVTGSPLESACRVIKKYEPAGRGFYSGVAALISHDERGQRTLDSAILIRTADIDRSGQLSAGVGATLVRHSDPLSEIAETRAKAAALLAAMNIDAVPLGEHPEVREALARRNAGIAGFWLEGAGHQAPRPSELAGRKLLIVDAEDTFTSMIDHQLTALDMSVTLCQHDDIPSVNGYDLVVLGPGPGDPRDDRHPKIANLRAVIGRLLDEQTPFLAVCLSHQVLSRRLGLPLYRRETPNQGVQHEIDLFGRRERVGFYNSFAARWSADTVQPYGLDPIEVCRDPATAEVYALRGSHFASLQFHAESVLTRNGLDILGSLLREVVTS